jgi:hypothetical protein
MSTATAPDLPLDDRHSFWRWQVAGWLVYGIAMFIAAVQELSFSQALVNKSVNVSIGLALSLGLRALFLGLRERGTPLPRILGALLLACLLAGAAWSLLANAFFWFYMRGNWQGMQANYLFAWTVVHAIIFVAWCAIYLAAVQFDELQRVRAQARAASLGASGSPLVVKAEGELLRLPQEQIHCIEAARNYSCIVSDAGTHVVRLPLTALAAKLDARCFIRVHRSAIVSVRKLQSLRALPSQDAIATLQGGREIRVSRGFRAGVEQALASRH